MRTALAPYCKTSMLALIGTLLTACEAAVPPAPAAVSPELAAEHDRLIALVDAAEQRVLEADQKTWLAGREDHCSAVSRVAGHVDQAAQLECRRTMDADRRDELLRLHRNALLSAAPSDPAISATPGRESDPVTIPTGKQVTALAFLPSTALFAAAGDRFVATRERQTGKLVRVYETGGGETNPRPIRRLFASDNGRLLFTAANGEKLLRVWDVGTATAVGEIELTCSDCPIALAGGGQFVVTAMDKITISSLTTGVRQEGVYSLSNPAIAVATDRAQRYLAASTSRGIELFMQERDAGRLVLRPVAAQALYTASERGADLAFSADGSSLLAVSSTGTVHRLGVPSLVQTAMVQTELTQIQSMAATPDNALVFLAGRQNAVHGNRAGIEVVDLESGTTKPLPAPTNGYGQSLLLDFEGKTLISGDAADIRMLRAPLTTADFAALVVPPPDPPQPQQGRIAVPQIPSVSTNAVVHVVQVYEGTLPNGRKRGFREQATGDVDLHVGGTQPVVLMLMAYDSVRWRIRADLGTRIEQILTFGSKRQTVEGNLAGAHVFTSPPTTTPLGYDSDRRTAAIAAKELTGREIATFSKKYTGDEFWIGAAPAPASAAGAAAIRRYVDENGTVHFEDSRQPSAVPGR